MSQLAQIHTEWKLQEEKTATLNLSDSDPHDKYTKESDYMLHYVDRSGSEDAEKRFQDRVAEINRQLNELSGITTSAPVQESEAEDGTGTEPDGGPEPESE